MARLFTSGAEWNDTTAENVTLGALLTISSANPRSGSFAYRNASGSNFASFPTFTGVLGRTYYGRVYANFAALPAASVATPVSITDSGATWSSFIRVFPDGSVDLRVSGVTYATLPAGTVTTGGWNLYELSANIGTGSVDAFEGRFNGVSFGSGSGLAISDTVVGVCKFGSGGNGGNVDFDDAAFNDDQGANQNSWPGSGKVVLLKPISDSAIGTGWTLGTGTAISANSGSTAVKNTPPVGVADLTAGSDTKQIRNASSSANVNYDANLTTYTTAGVGASDTVNVLVPMVSTSAPVVTSAKLGNVGLASNPAITLVALGAGGTAGAFWSGVAGGTYPTGWKWSFGTTTYAPTVTLGTSPVMRIQQVTASTRIAVVDAMGMYVDYTPAVVAVTTPPKPTVVMQAVNRAATW